jgi:HPt (histidine-containing phosphotransfer) domain-containing protein
MDDFLSKPIEAAALWAAVRRNVRASPRIATDQAGLLSPRAILSASGGRASTVQHLCEALREGLSVHAGQLRAAYRDSDMGRLGDLAHTLAGMLSAFSVGAGATASALEDAARERCSERSGQLVHQLEEMCAILHEQTRSLTLEDLYRLVEATATDA